MTLTGTGAAPSGRKPSFYNRSLNWLWDFIEGRTHISKWPYRPQPEFSFNPSYWTGAFVAVEGDAEAAAEGERIALALGARPYRLAATDRALYHAAATLAAGGTAALVSIATRGWVAAGIP